MPKVMTERVEFRTSAEQKKAITMLAEATDSAKAKRCDWLLNEEFPP